MQVVDVLRDDRRQPAGRLKLRQLPVRVVGLGRQKKHLLAVKPVKHRRVVVEKSAAENHLGRIVIALAVKPVGAAEIGDAALCRNPRPAEKDDAARSVHHLLKPLKLLHDKIPPLVKNKKTRRLPCPKSPAGSRAGRSGRRGAALRPAARQRRAVLRPADARLWRAGAAGTCARSPQEGCGGPGLRLYRMTMRCPQWRQ